MSCCLSLRHEIRPNHLRPATELAERVLLPGDPHRALAVAQELLDGPQMFNHHRGLWGYTGLARDGQPLTIQSTGMGGPSAAIVVEELIGLGARRLVRIGTCGALDPELELGELVAVERALPADGASAALGANGAVAPHAGLLERLVAGGARALTVASTDLFYDPRDGRDRRLARPGRAGGGDGGGHDPAARGAARRGGGLRARRDRRAGRGRRRGATGRAGGDRGDRAAGGRGGLRGLWRLAARTP